VVPKFVRLNWKEREGYSWRSILWNQPGPAALSPVQVNERLPIVGNDSPAVPHLIKRLGTQVHMKLNRRNPIGLMQNSLGDSGRRSGMKRLKHFKKSDYGGLNVIWTVTLTKRTMTK
jgi:hypothetical protein